MKSKPVVFQSGPKTLNIYLYTNLTLKHQKRPESLDFVFFGLFFLFSLCEWDSYKNFQVLLEGSGGPLRSSKNPSGAERNYPFRNFRMFN